MMYEVLKVVVTLAAIAHLFWIYLNRWRPARVRVTALGIGYLGAFACMAISIINNDPTWIVLCLGIGALLSYRALGRASQLGK